MSKKIVWFASFVLTAIFIFQTTLHIYTINHFKHLNSKEIATQKDFSNYLAGYYKKYPLDKNETVYYVPTGIFLESFKFVSSNVVGLSGYIWQRYTDDLLKKINPGIIFPEATQVKSYQAYKIKKGDSTTIGWYFEGNFAKSFDYHEYPLDHKVIEIRMWPSDFSKYIVLTPDFSAYASTMPKSKFGLDSEIVSQGYSLLETFFNYKLASYNTNFGISNYVGQENYPEFYYNLAIKRNVLNTMVTYLLPLCVVVVFAFVLLVNVSMQTESGILSSCATFLFVILLSHIRLRENLAEGSIVYIEYIYFILYFALIYVVLVSFFVIRKDIQQNNRYLKLIIANDYLLLKVIFLPMLFGSILLATKLIL